MPITANLEINLFHLNKMFWESFPKFHIRSMNSWSLSQQLVHVHILRYQVKRAIGLNGRRSVKPVKTRVRNFILRRLCGVEKTGERPRCWTAVPPIPIIGLTTAIYRTRRKTTSWNRIVRTSSSCRFHLSRLALFVSFPPWKERVFPRFLVLFLFRRSFLPIFFWTQWWALEIYSSCMVSCFCQELIRAKTRWR